MSEARAAQLSGEVPAGAAAAAPARAVIECRDLWKIFGPRPQEALAAARDQGLSRSEVQQRFGCVVGVAGVSLTIERGEIFCIMGLSGSGKSTLVRHINRLIRPTAGEVFIDGEAVGSKSEAEMRHLRAEKIGMVFQNFALLPHRTVIENVAFGLELRDEPRQHRLAAAAEMLDLVKLADWSRHWPDELSGGMQQRVGLARALAGGPDILLMDEPFGALDPLIRRQLQEQFLELSRLMRKTTVFITHDLDEAIRLGTRIAIMRDGAIVQVGTPNEIVRNPADDYVAAFVSGTSRQRLLRARDIMRPLGGIEPPAPWPRVSADSDTDALIAQAVGRDEPTVIVDDGAPVGLVDKDALLKSLAGGAAPHPNSLPQCTPADVAESPALQVPLSRAAGPRVREAAAAPARRFDLAALLGGPLWAAWHGLWLLFAATLFGDVVAFVLIGQALVPDASGATGEHLATGLILLGVVRIGLAVAAARLLEMAERTRRIAPAQHAAVAPRRATLATVLLAAIYGLTLYGFVAPEPAAAITAFPQPAGFDSATAKTIDGAVDWMKRNWVDFFDAVTALLRAVLNFIELVFVATPWPVVGLCCLAIAWGLSGPRTAIFTAAALAYLGLLGLWEESMATIALVATSVLICVVIGIPVGVVCAKSRRANTAIEPILDVMQTLPTFVYLIPAVAFFSIGKPPGVIATVIFAMPPMIRLTALGIRQVPTQVREAAEAFGASPVQLLRKVELPLAVPSIRLGVNQTIMMSLSMVVVAAMIGAGGLGLDVIRSLQHLKTGQGVLAGVAIVLCAMVLDRMVRGREARQRGRER